MSSQVGNHKVERPQAAELRSRDILGTYVHRSDAGDQPYMHRVLPRGVTDIFWGPGPTLRVGGPDRRSTLVSFPPNATVVGVRIRPGRAGALLGVPMCELADRRFSLSEVWGRAGERLAEQVGEATSTAEATALMVEALTERATSAPPLDPLVDAAVTILRDPTTTCVSHLGDRLGVSDRHLRRRFITAVGYGPKTFHRIMRLGRFVCLAASQPGARLDQLAIETGHADHAHLSRECRLLAGLTPSQLARGGSSNHENGNVRSVLVWEPTSP
jgi:AraC-like DNA-binding protein